MAPQTRSPFEDLRRAVQRQSAERDRELDQLAAFARRNFGSRTDRLEQGADDAPVGGHQGTSPALLDRLDALIDGTRRGACRTRPERSRRVNVMSDS